jgi:hypothetical protein
MHPPDSLAGNHQNIFVEISARIKSTSRFKTGNDASR